MNNKFTPYQKRLLKKMFVPKVIELIQDYQTLSAPDFYKKHGRKIFNGTSPIELTEVIKRCFE